MSHVELNHHALSAFSRLSLSDGIYVFPNFYLGIFSTLEILQKFQVGFFTFSWFYSELVGISSNYMYYFHQSIGCLTHCDCVVMVLHDG